MPIQQPAVYCPGPDEQLENSIASMLLSMRNAYQQPLMGGKGQLGDLNANAKLYLFVHSYSQMSVFSTETEMWTGEEMAALMEKDGLSKDHRDLELLVCSAGLAMTTKKAQKELKRLYALYLEAKKSGDEAATKKAAATFTAAEKKVKKPKEYEANDQTLPLVCELVDALKQRQYRKIQVTSYKVPVAMTFSQGKIHLSLESLGGEWGVPADDDRAKGLKVVWR